MKTAPSLPPSLPRTEILGVPVTRAGYAPIVTWVMECAQKRISAQIAVAPVHSLSVARWDPEHMKALQDCHIVTADGQPVRWALNLLGKPRLEERVYGPSLTLKLCEVAQEKGLAVYFYGSKPQVLNLLKKELQRRFPRLHVFTHSPGKVAFPCFSPKDATSSRATGGISNMKTDLKRIRSSGASILFVGLGCPKQERWLHIYGPTLSMPSLGVGATFDFLARNLKQAPAWMQERGLEWAFRFSHEPRRLWKRYLIGNTVFLWSLARQLISARHQEKFYSTLARTQKKAGQV